MPITEIKIPYTDEMIPEKFFHDALRYFDVLDHQQYKYDPHVAVSHKMLTRDVMLADTGQPNVHGKVLVIAINRGYINHPDRYITFEVVTAIRDD